MVNSRRSCVFVGTTGQSSSFVSDSARRYWSTSTRCRSYKRLFGECRVVTLPIGNGWQMLKFTSGKLNLVKPQGASGKDSSR